MSWLSRLARKEYDEVITEKINNFQGTPVAFSKVTESILYLEYISLGDFNFFKLLIIGKLNVETIKGSFVKFVSDQREIGLESDTLEISTGFSDTLKKGFTELEVDISDAIHEMIMTEDLKYIIIDFENARVEFTVQDQKSIKNLLSHK